MDEIDIKKEINLGVDYLNFCTSTIKQGNKDDARTFFKIVKVMIDEYPEKSAYLKDKYQKVKILYEAKFGKLEEELQ